MSKIFEQDPNLHVKQPRQLTSIVCKSFDKKFRDASSSAIKNKMTPNEQLAEELQK